uniref:Tr-type G domain-containing protein n=1 Tax=Chromera velia CCMP2878 TaxID=1169474 RepID=A0A0G4GHK8_9ALVE|eukprot:Cvel_655.t1-p1 / transcript=Cvel_655.t1 / gene=Cvel_655 / organism=Chromera_velia_CCMP2878 / gene_product=GTP-binding protein TypA/BipA homolog, putative / transcript_product=GTP-binding protein TypA/BipA homolog, putative / location=Cvel_scaffold20:74750-80099(-) / protein_length=628 / sequence_SO=supercontig / SO=protein_coding / is_pseudo=false
MPRRSRMSRPVLTELFQQTATAEETAEKQTRRDDIRNIAIIAHVDHGKTTLVDAMLKEAHVFRDGAVVQDRVMDSNDQERERGITILAKNTAIDFEGTKINIVDTPGHADFGGEVERIMNMVDGVLLVVDANEGPKPQTRFVLKKALELGNKAVVVINKVDRPNARPDEVVDKTFDLFLELGATDDQANFEIIYASGLLGQSGNEPDQLETSMTPLFKKVLQLPGPVITEGAPLQMMITNIDFDQYKGRLAIGRLGAGTLEKGMQVGVMRPGEEPRRNTIGELFVFDNLGKKPVDKAVPGDVVCFSGLKEFTIGDTVVDLNNPRPLEPIKVEDPTVRMTFKVNTSPLLGKDPDSKFLTINQLRDRLEKELDRNVALKVDFDSEGEGYIVSGRGQMHLTVLVENMRREGYELMVGPPSVIEKKIDGVKCEPWEALEVTVPEEHMGAVIEVLSARKAEMSNMETLNGQTTLFYLIPTRATIGLRSQLLTASKGFAVIDSTFDSYRPSAGVIQPRERGSLIATADGTCTGEGVKNAQERGDIFVSPGDKIYRGMIVGINSRNDDLRVNICKEKRLTNMRSATKEAYEGIATPLELTLDSAVEYIDPDEILEVTPNSIRMLKKNRESKGRGM